MLNNWWFSIDPVITESDLNVVCKLLSMWQSVEQVRMFIFENDLFHCFAEFCTANLVCADDGGVLVKNQLIAHHAIVLIWHPWSCPISLFEKVMTSQPLHLGNWLQLKSQPLSFSIVSLNGQTTMWKTKPLSLFGCFLAHSNGGSITHQNLTNSISGCTGQGLFLLKGCTNVLDVPQIMPNFSVVPSSVAFSLECALIEKDVHTRVLKKVNEKQPNVDKEEIKANLMDMGEQCDNFFFNVFNDCMVVELKVPSVCCCLFGWQELLGQQKWLPWGCWFGNETHRLGKLRKSHST